MTREGDPGGVVLQICPLEGGVVEKLPGGSALERRSLGDHLGVVERFQCELEEKVRQMRKRRVPDDQRAVVAQGDVVLDGVVRIGDRERLGAGESDGTAIYGGRTDDSRRRRALASRR